MNDAVTQATDVVAPCSATAYHAQLSGQDVPWHVAHFSSGCALCYGLDAHSTAQEASPSLIVACLLLCMISDGLPDA